MKILHVYAGDQASSRDDLARMFPEATEILSCVVQDVAVLHKDQARFEVIVCNHALQTVARDNVIETMQHMVDMLQPKGELWVIVPDFEWACSEALKQDSSPVPQLMIYGMGGIQYKSGHTTLSLRALIENSGLITRRAYQEGYKIMWKGSDKTAVVPQNVVVGMKLE